MIDRFFHPPGWFLRFSTWLSTLVVLVSTLVGVTPLHADAGSYLTSPAYQDLTQAIQQTKDPARLAELQALEQVMATAGDRAQLTNDTSHNIGVFSRYKKDPVDADATFYVLGPGHQTDDDQILLAFYLPEDVSLTWGDNGHIDAARHPRLARILDGEQLVISSLDPASASASDPTTDAPQPVSYQLNLPAFSVASRQPGIASLPALSQDALDLELETAPLD